jgi:hypothetical protein
LTYNKTIMTVFSVRIRACTVFWSLGPAVARGRRARLHTVGSQRLTAPDSRRRVLCDWSEIRSARHGMGSAAPLASSRSHSHVAAARRRRPSVSVLSRPRGRAGPTPTRRAAACGTVASLAGYGSPSGGRRDRRDGDAPADAAAPALAHDSGGTARLPAQLLRRSAGFLRCFLDRPQCVHRWTRFSDSILLLNFTM